MKAKNDAENVCFVIVGLLAFEVVYLTVVTAVLTLTR
jgi:hypothetical protein